MLDWVTVGRCQLKVSFCMGVSLRALSPVAIVGKNLGRFLEIITTVYNFSRLGVSVVWTKSDVTARELGHEF